MVCVSWGWGVTYNLSKGLLADIQQNVMSNEFLLLSLESVRVRLVSLVFTWLSPFFYYVIIPHIYIISPPIPSSPSPTATLCLKRFPLFCVEPPRLSQDYLPEPGW